MLCLRLITPEDVYDAYVQEQRELHGDASGACSRSFFNRVWRESVKSLKLTQGRDFMVCNICTLSKQTLYGTPGGPATEDPAVRKATEKDLQEHIEVRITCVQRRDIVGGLKGGWHYLFETRHYLRTSSFARGCQLVF